MDGKWVLGIWVVLVLSLEAGSSGQPRQSSAGDVATDVVPAQVMAIFEARCSMCHGGKNPAASMDLSTPNDVLLQVGQPSMERPSILRIDLGDPERSYLVMNWTTPVLCFGSVASSCDSRTSRARSLLLRVCTLLITTSW